MQELCCKNVVLALISSKGSHGTSWNGVRDNAMCHNVEPICSDCFSFVLNV
jgi:hypothetical protein